MMNALSKKYTSRTFCVRTPVELGNSFNCKKITSEGIWDTGATNSCITRKAAQALGLSPFQRTWMMGVHGGKVVNVYLVEITLHNKSISAKVRMPECEELSPDGSVGALIGMDIITMGDFCLTNYGGKTTMTFRMPSVETIDYVEEVNEYNKFLTIHNQRMLQGDGSCPCGSGKKWEDCHGMSKYSTY